MAALVYFLVSTRLWGGILSVSDIHLFYFMNTLDVIFCIINAHGVIGMCLWLAKYLPDALISAFTILSRNINTIYIAQWFFVPLTGILIAYFFRNVVVDDLLNSIIAICMLVLATMVALGYNRLKSR